jgi:leucyl aminopeptidase
MQLKLETGSVSQVDSDALVMVGFEGTPPDGPAAGQVAGQIKEFYDSGEFSGKSGEVAVLHHPAGFSAKRLVLGGGGKRERFDAAELRKLTGVVVRALKSKGIHTIALVLDEPFRSDDFTAAAVEGAVLADLENDRYKTDPKKSEKHVDLFAVLGGSQAGVDRGRIIAEAQNFSRDIANEPANVLTPTILADQAKKMASEFGLECEILDQDRMRQLGMGALLGVAQGSAEPPALIVLRYKPAKAPTSKDHLGLIGKGVTFDTGGISIKPSDGMEKMRYDMAGGAAVIGAMRAIAQLKPSIPVTALVPTVENMPGSKAQRPGDIVKSLSGKTIEVLNTDAEGRVVLGDALVYARERGATTIIDFATLTGACVVALGGIAAGLLGNDEALQEKIRSAGERTGDRVWPLPLWQEYKDKIKSDVADIKNTGGRYGGAITAAAFLAKYVGEVPWAHLDIAGTAWTTEELPYLTKGATGFGVRLVVDLLSRWS